MPLIKDESYVLGLDYGTDSCRAVLIDASDGSQAGVAVKYYPRWKDGLYCNAAMHQFRQHPLDYIETLEGTLAEIIRQVGCGSAAKIKGIAIDTTGSTPCAVDGQGCPLALKAEFAENPGAMFILWKDHSAMDEAARITQLAKSWGGCDYTCYTGGLYSCEWFWAKILRVFKEDPRIAEQAVSFLEHCDWMPMLLTGCNDIQAARRSSSAMGHKALWHASFDGGYPSADFFSRLDPRLVKIRDSLGSTTYTSDTCAGFLASEWADRLGIPAGIPVAVGALDAHMGAVGGGIQNGWLVKVMGTSCTDILVGPLPHGREVPVPGICGQVDGSIIPGMIGYEAGQSSFGDAYAWFKNLLLWPLRAITDLKCIDAVTQKQLAGELSRVIIPMLEKYALELDSTETGIIALDWFNGRRTPDVNPYVQAAVTGLHLGCDAPNLYRALVEATAFGSRAIMERFREEGMTIRGIIGIGGIARKSSFIMQIIADVLNIPIHIPAGDQIMALGATMFASVAAGLYPDINSAQQAMRSPIEKMYTPGAAVNMYNSMYKHYTALGQFTESR